MICRSGSKTLSDLIRVHRGRAAVVMGGAPSLPRDLAELVDWPGRTSAVYLSANDHAFKLPAPVDYIVACDNIEQRLRVHGRPIIAPRHWADFRVLHQVVSNSAALACVVAWAMGCSPIVVTGVELYSAGTYFHDERAHSPGKTANVQQHLRRWSKLIEASVGAYVRPVSGPLLQRFPRFDSNEAAMPADPEDMIASIIGGSRVEITRDVPDWHGRSLVRGSVVEMRTSEAGKAIADGYGRAHGHR